MIKLKSIVLGSNCFSKLSKLNWLCLVFLYVWFVFGFILNFFGEFKNSSYGSLCTIFNMALTGDKIFVISHSKFNIIICLLIIIKNIAKKFPSNQKKIRLCSRCWLQKKTKLWYSYEQTVARKICLPLLWNCLRKLFCSFQNVWTCTLLLH